ncbi:hypothetical protein OMAG_001895 [Candidatus Omnitrophus magneticus]|uniref:Uncharacterized protein n=1 Tax=Candidatus Omnitrophus magneticus TaxID=1609969 RepID=A0A0F0CRU0_9BACT|nr:hypothetical protein OMAG_001895 [Candidatus Omnitrophus magneticus]
MPDHFIGLIFLLFCFFVKTKKILKNLHFKNTLCILDIDND